MEEIETIIDLYLDTGVLYVDNSILSTVAQCETKGIMQYGYSLIPEDDDRGPMVAGSAAHKALEVHFLGGSPEEAIEALFAEYFEYAVANFKEGDRLSYANVSEVVKSWIWHHPLAKLPFVPMKGEDGVPLVEMPYCLPLTSDGSIMFTGSIDLVGTRRDGEGVILIDTKTTGRVDEKFKRQFELGSQMTGYCWALEQLLGRPVTSIYVNVVDMKLVPTDKKRKCSIHKAPYADCGFMHMKHTLAGPYARAPHVIAAWKRNAVKLARQWKLLIDNSVAQGYNISRVGQSGMFRYNTCNSCAYDRFCRGGRDMRSQDLLFFYEPWYPGTTKEIINARQDR